MTLIVFDLDGTLTDTMEVDDRLFREALTENMPEGTAAGTIPQWEDFTDVTDPAIVRAVITRATGRPARETEIIKVRQAFIKKWEQAIASDSRTVTPILEATRMLPEAMNRPGYFAAIATGGWEPTALMKIHHGGFAVDNLVVSTADDSESRAAIVRTTAIYAAAARGIPGFSRMVIVGDGVWDARAAQQVKCSFIGVSADAETALRLRGLGAVDVIPDYVDRERFWAAVDAAAKRAARSSGN